MKEEVSITTRQVKTLNASSGYIQMPKKNIGEWFVVMTKQQFDYYMKK